MNILTREIIYLSRCVCYRSIRHIIATDVAFVAGVAALSAADVAAAPAAAPAVAVAAVSASVPDAAVAALSFSAAAASRTRRFVCANSPVL